MRIISNGIDFDLPTGFAAELARYNVLLSDAGEQTAPITLKATPMNLKLVGYSDRLDNVYKPLTDLDVTVIDGLFYRNCNLGIHTVNEQEGISCTLYLGTGEFYSKVGTKKLASLAWPIIKSPTYDNQTTTARIEYLINQMKDVFSGTFHSQFGVTRVVTSQDYEWYKERLSSITITTVNGSPVIQTNISYIKYPGKLILNAFETEHMRFFPAINESFSLLLFEAERIQTIIKDSIHIPLPIGYGMTPFLRIRYILEMIFSDYASDFTAISTKFPDFDNDLLINNVADAVCGGYIMYSQLVPDVTVKEFVDYLEKRYGGKFIINENTKTVYFVDYDAVNDSPDIDITNYLTTRAKIGSAEFENIIVQYNSDIKVENYESKIKQTILDFDFLKRVEMKINTSFGDANYVYHAVDLTMILVDVGDIIHKNSKLVVDGKTIVEDVTKQTDIKIITLDSVTNTSFTYTSSSPYTFTTETYNPDPIHSIPIHPDVKSFYEKYIAFRSGSNIPVEAEMNIPASELEKLQLHVPKILHGQPVMIESIKYALGKKGTQAITLRTLRPYSDR